MKFVIIRQLLLLLILYAVYYLSFKPSQNAIQILILSGNYIDMCLWEISGNQILSIAYHYVIYTEELQFKFFIVVALKYLIPTLNMRAICIIIKPVKKQIILFQHR